MVDNMRKENRKLKVCEQSGYKYKPTPMLMLKGAWLEEWGFTPDMPVSVQNCNCQVKWQRGKECIDLWVRYI